MKEQIKMFCLFCKSEQFELPKEGYQPSCGEMIKCANCGRLNDYTSMLNITKEKAIEIAKAEAKKIIKNTMKNFKLK
jgi:uncharacterized Zn finger protein